VVVTVSWGIPHFLLIMGKRSEVSYGVREVAVRRPILERAEDRQNVGCIVGRSNGRPKSIGHLPSS
jgi:hypothetical protein